MLRFAWYSQQSLEHPCEAQSTLREGGPIRSTAATDSATTLSPPSFTVATQQVLGSISPVKILTSNGLHTAPKEDLFQCTQYTFGWPFYISSVRVTVFTQRYHATCDVLLHHSKYRYTCEHTRLHTVFSYALLALHTRRSNENNYNE